MFVRKETPSPTLSERSAKDGRHCDLCGSPSPAVRCDKCGGHCFCLSCDDMYHRHPKRKSHQRKAADSVVPGSGPGVSRRAAAAPGDPSKMPIPPPRKKKGKSIFASLTGSSGSDVPALPKKEFSLTEKLGSIRRFMSNRPLPPIPKENDRSTSPRGTQAPRMPAAFNTQAVLDRQNQAPKSKTPSEDGFPDNRASSPQYQNILSHLTKLAQSSCEEWEEEPSTSGSARGSSGGEEGWGQETRARRHAPNPPPLYPRGRSQEEPQWTGTLRRGQTAPYVHPASGFGIPGLSSSATDLTTLGLPPGSQGGPVPGFPYMYPPGVPPMYPQFAPAQSMGRLNYPYFGGSWTNIRKKGGTDADEDADDDDEVDDESKRSTLTRRRHSESKMKRSQSVMYDPSLVPGAYFPFGGMPPPGYPGYMGPGYPYWAQPEVGPGIGLAPPSPSTAHRNLTRGQGRSRRRQQDEDSSASSYTGSNPRSSAGHPRSRRKQDHADGDLSSEEDDKEINARVNPKGNPGSKGNPGANPKTSPGLSSPKGGEKSDASVGSNPGKNPGGNPENNPSSNPGSNPNPGNAPTTTWECEFCTFINSPGSRICSICCKSIPQPHHDSDPPPGETMEAKKDINLTELSEEVIKEQERIEQEIRRQIEVKQKLNEESPGVQASQTNLTSMTEGSEHKTTEKPPSPLVSPPTSPVPPPSPIERLSPKLTVDVELSTVSALLTTGVEIQTQTEVSDKVAEPTETAKNIQTETSSVSVQSESVSTQIEEPKPTPQFPKILTPSKLDSSCQTNGDLQGLQNDLSVRPKMSQSVAHQTEDISRIREVPSPRGLHVEMGTSPPPQDFFAPPIIIAEPEPYERRFGLLHRSLSQTSLNGDREFRRKTREEESFGQLTRSLSRGSLASEPGTGGFSGGQHGRSSRNQPSAFAPVGSGPRNLYTSDWNLHRRTDWEEDPNKTGRHSTLGPWQSANLNRRKSAGYYLEELAERRRQEQMRSQGLEMVRIVRKAEQAGFVPDDLEVALANCGDQDPVDWLEENWRNMIETVATLATNYGHDKPENDVGIVSAGEARSALRIHRGNIWSAVTECVETRQRKCLDIQSRAEFTRREVIAALTAQEGSSELAYEQLLQSKPYPEKPFRSPEREPELQESEPRFLQTGNSTFFDARMPSRDQGERHLNVRPDIRRSSLVDNYAPEQQPGRNVSRRFSYSAGITQGLPSATDYFGTQRTADISDAQSFTSEDIEAAAAAVENIPEQERERDRLNWIKSRRAAQKEVKRSASFLDKLASLRKDKQQAERKPNESRFLRYGSLNVLTVDTSGLRQSSFEEAMSSDIDAKTDIQQPQKKGFLSRLLHRSSSTDERFPKSEFFVGREAPPQLPNFPPPNVTQEHLMTADKANVSQLLAEPSAIEKVQAYLNQIQQNQSSPPAPEIYPQTASFTPAVSQPNVFPAQPQMVADTNQLHLMLQKLGLLPQETSTQIIAHHASEGILPETITAQPEMITAQPEMTLAHSVPLTSSTILPPLDVPTQESEIKQSSEIATSASTEKPVSVTLSPSRDTVLDHKVTDTRQNERTKLNNNSLKAQWLGIDLSSPAETDITAKVEEIFPLTMTPDRKGMVTTEVLSLQIVSENQKAVSPVIEPNDFGLKGATEIIKPIVQNDRPVTPVPEIMTDSQLESNHVIIEPIVEPGPSTMNATQKDLAALKTYLQESLIDEKTESLADEPEEKPRPFEDSFKEIRQFYVGPPVIKKGTSLELEDDDSYFEGTVDGASSKEYEQFGHDSGFESKKLSVTQSSTIDLSSDISDSVPETDADIESVGYTDVESPEHAIEEYVQAIVSDNLKSQPPILLPTQEKPPDVSIAEPDLLDIPQSPVRRRRRSSSRDKLGKQAVPQQVTTEKVDEPKTFTVSPEPNSTKAPAAQRLSRTSRKAANASEEAESKTPIIPNSISPVESSPKSDGKPTAIEIVSVPVTTIAKPQIVSNETPTTLLVHRPEVPEVPTKAEVIPPVQDTKVATAVGSARVRRQRSISRDRRVTLSREASEAVPKESTTIRRRSSTKQDSGAAVKVEAVETGRKSLRDTKKALSSESKLDRYRKSAKSPEKQGKAEAQSSQNGAVMSAKRLALDTRIKELLAKDQCGSYEQAEMAARLMEMNFGEEEALQAAKECGSLYQAISFLQQDCELCAGKFHVAEMVSMLHCTHRACRECLKAYFSIQIRDRNILELLCPYCSEPDLTDDDVASDYFNHMDLMLKNLVEPEIHELFHRKLRDRALMKDPNFRWCSQCSSGFIINNPNQRRLLCPDCKAVTCASCRKLWEKQHEGISCQQFQEWKEANDPELQAAGLAQHLAENGIDCPNCHFRYSLAKGGCMHFRCIQCQYDFCSGCSKPFKMGQKCGVSDFCAKLGLHAHHPRNCLFYLRDKEPEDLQKLLDELAIPYNKVPPTGSDVKRVCQVMEQKETPEGLRDDICGKDVLEDCGGLCRIHYVEYLGGVITKNNVDPLPIFNLDELELVLKRASIRLPHRFYRTKESDYMKTLIKVGFFFPSGSTTQSSW